MSFVAFIPARAGSKRIPNKNIQMLGGKPLLIWTLEACIACKRISKVILSTDSELYMDIAKKNIQSAKLKFDLRASEQAGDNIKIFDYLKWQKEKIFSDVTEEHFILALPTAPLRSTVHIDEAILMFLSEGKPIFSATEYEFPISFAFTKNLTKGWEPIFKDSPMLNGNTRSQDNEVTYRPNGAIYIRAISDLAFGEINTLYDNAMPYIMSQTNSIDIDVQEDLDIAEAILSKGN